jgi:hypothetical protein
METVEVPEKETKRVSVTLKRIAENSGNSAGDDGKAVLPVTPAPKPNRTVPYAIGIGGGVLLVGSGVFYLMRQSQINTLNSLCGGPGECHSTEVDKVNHEKSKLNTYNALMTITGIGGLAAVGVAVGLLVLEPKTPKPQASSTSLYLDPAAPGANVGGMSLAGAF